MKRIVYTILACFLTLIQAHAQGIVFSQASFEEAKQIASQQNKLIFVDFYTVWCGPCKMLAKNVFPQPQVGEFFNKHFVCLQLDAEKEGKELARNYQVEAYPSLVFLRPDGEMLGKVVGSVRADKLIASAQDAINAQSNPNNLVNMTKRYEAGERNADFLLAYIDCLTKQRVSPIQPIEDFLAVQTSWPHDSSKLMEFFMEHTNHLLLGGKAEEILVANQATYMDIATRSEELKLKNMLPTMLRSTRIVALKQHDPSLYRVFMNRWEKLDEKPYHQTHTELRLELLQLEGQEKAYRKLGFQYLDSLTTARTPAEIKVKDDERFEEYNKTHPKTGNMYAEAVRSGYEDLDAKVLIADVVSIGTHLLKDASRKELKKLQDYTDYGFQLLPEDKRLKKFEALLRDAATQEKKK